MGEEQNHSGVERERLADGERARPDSLDSDADSGEKPAPDKQEEFVWELTALINRHSLENGSNTPDFMLALYLMDCLHSWNRATRAREQWYGRGPVLSATVAESGTGESRSTERARSNPNSPEVRNYS